MKKDYCLSKNYFVLIRAAPSFGKYPNYFYNRTEKKFLSSIFKTISDKGYRKKNAFFCLIYFIEGMQKVVKRVVTIFNK